jgi:hypothetical protein
MQTSKFNILMIFFKIDIVGGSSLFAGDCVTFQPDTTGKGPNYKPRRSFYQADI